MHCFSRYCVFAVFRSVGCDRSRIWLKFEASRRYLRSCQNLASACLVYLRSRWLLKTENFRTDGVDEKAGWRDWSIVSMRKEKHGMWNFTRLCLVFMLSLLLLFSNKLVCVCGGGFHTKLLQAVYFLRLFTSKNVELCGVKGTLSHLFLRMHPTPHGNRRRKKLREQNHFVVCNSTPIH